MLQGYVTWRAISASCRVHFGDHSQYRIRVLKLGEAADSQATYNTWKTCPVSRPSTDFT
jgi:hypothetical protein